MKKGILFSIIAMIGLASCQQKEDFTLPIEGEKMTFYASIADDATKTTAEVDGEKTKVLWTKDDAYSLSVKGGAFAKFTLDGEGGKTTGTFSGTAVEGEGTQNIAYYPYTEGVTLTDDKLSVVFPSVQAYSANSIAAAPMVAVSTDNTLKFQNVASLIKITIKGEKIIKSVSLTGNNDESLAGNAVVTLGATPSLALAADAEGKTITLNCGEGIKLTEGGVDFYFAVPATTLTKGFTVVAIDSEEKAMIKSTTKEVVLTASKVKVFPAFEYENNVTEVSSAEQITTAISEGRNIKLTKDITLSAILVINEDIIFDGNGHTLTSSAGRAINVSGAANVTIKNLTINASGERAINIIQNAKKVTIDNVTATAANYTVNVAGSAPNVVVDINKSTLSGLNVVNVNGQGANVTVTNSTINCNDNNTTEGESYAALCLGKDATGGIITATDCTINVTEGSDSQKGRNSAYNGNVTIDGSDEGIKVNSAFIILGDYYYGYETLADALADVKEDVTIVELSRDVVLTEALTIPEGKTLTLDLKGKTITGTDNQTASFGLINLNPGSNLTINSTVATGNIKMTATNNRGWNAYSSVVSNQRATLTVGENVVIEHLGGTDMAYGIDNLTNTGAEHAKTTIDGATIKSTYRAIRQFLNSCAEGVNNELYVKSGVIEGPNKSIWMQDANANANPGKLVVEQGAQLKGDVYLTVTAGSTEWPVEVSISTLAVGKSSVLCNNNVPYGYALYEDSGNWVVKKLVNDNNEIEIGSASELLWFANEVNVKYNIFTGKTIKLTSDIDLTGIDWIPISMSKDLANNRVFNGTFDGGNHTISGMSVNQGEVAGLFGYIYGATIKNVTINNANINSNHFAGGIVAWVLNNKGNQTRPFIMENCNIYNTTIKSSPEWVGGSYDNGDKAGGLIGYAVFEGNDGAIIDDCSVNATTVTAYRDLGGLIGYAKGVVLQNCTTFDVEVIQDLTNGYKDTKPTTVGEIIGRNDGGNVVNGNAYNGN